MKLTISIVTLLLALLVGLEWLGVTQEIQRQKAQAETDRQSAAEDAQLSQQIYKVEWSVLDLPFDIPPRMELVHAGEFEKLPSCKVKLLLDGSRFIPLNCGIGPSLNSVRRFITNIEVCDSLYAPDDRTRTGLRCYERGKEPAL